MPSGSRLRSTLWVPASGWSVDSAGEPKKLKASKMPVKRARRPYGRHFMLMIFSFARVELLHRHDHQQFLRKAQIHKHGKVVLPIMLLPIPSS